MGNGQREREREIERESECPRCVTMGHQQCFLFYISSVIPYDYRNVLMAF